MKNKSEDIITIVPGCPNLNDSFFDLLLLSKITGVIQIFVCVFGSFAIISCLFIFRNVTLNNLFNQILLLLSMSHLLFLLEKFFSYLTIHMGYSTLALIYTTMLHPLIALSMTLSIYLTMSLSVHFLGFFIIHLGTTYIP